MEYRKNVSNPMLAGSIELLKAENTPEHQQLFWNELLKAKLLSPVAIDPVPEPDEEGNAKPAPGSKVQFPMLSTKDGRKFFMAFTDRPEMDKWPGAGDDPQFFALSFKEYADLLLHKDAKGNFSPATGFVVNPYGGNIAITREMLAKVIAANWARVQKAKAAKEAQDRAKTGEQQ